MPRLAPESVIGRSPERLTIQERIKLTGKFYAQEIYTPEKIPLRIIEAIGDSIDDCVRQLRSRGLDPRRYEYLTIGRSF